MLMPLCGKSVLARTVEAFVNTRIFDDITVVSSEKNMEAFCVELKPYPVKIVLGGATRGESSLALKPSMEISAVIFSSGSISIIFTIFVPLAVLDASGI